MTTMMDTMELGQQGAAALKRLEEDLRRDGNAITSAKFGQLADKAQSRLTAIAFCGHFSAGKSTLINRLCGHPLLPSSPIPTSANLVSIRSGEPGAEVTRIAAMAGGGQERVVEKVPLSELDAYCVNGEDIEAVRITYPLPMLGDRGMLLDTPGIDSTDDAHQLATESALHLADVVFYVMDYNHVQSEINFAFAKKMKDWGKPLYLIVNMIDKHREQELPFESYRASAEEAFRSWGIEAAGMLFVTTKVPQHPHNDFGRLRALIASLLGSGDELRRYSLDRSVRFLLEEHKAWLEDRNGPQREQLELRLEAEAAAGDGAEAGGLAAGAEAVREYEAKTKEREALLGAAERLTAELRKEAAGIIENANITPAPTRDLAHEYLQSRKPGFKVGLFGSAAKTAAEIERRLEAFRRNLAEQVEAQLDWHLRAALKQAAEREGVKSEALTAELETLGVEVRGDWLAAQVSGAAGFGSDYTLNYSKQAAAELKAQYRKLTFERIDRVAAAVQERAEAGSAQLDAELAALESKLGAWRELQQLAQQEAAALQAVAALWPEAPLAAPALPDPGALAPVQGDAGEPGADRDGDGAWGATVAIDTVLAASHTMKAAAAAGGLEEAAGRTAAAGWSGADYRRRLSASAGRLEQAAALLDPLAALRGTAAAMREKAARLRGGTFTIALFGAFSAGKSSFANALLGERILPVSPNPTTAAINRIVPPSAEWPHGTARVRMKSADAIAADVRYSLDVLGESASDMTDALARIRRLSPAAVPAKGKPHYAFLRAVEVGWAQAEPQLGRDVRITLDEFAAYVADEARSCFVEFIELHYANELTEQGIVFVDTPGADSINARHTGVAFDYIKNADAILFVTYYNHAFSQADREFLLQLGRVKDSFELDKMFFIINAADLASGPEELQGVLAHVESNLLQHGIRRPRLYPVSSLQAVEGKLAGDALKVEQSGIAEFERQFIRFSMEELASVAVHSAELELQRAEHTLSRWIERAKEGEAQRASRLQELEQALQAGESMLDGADFTEERKELAKDIRELLYYVKQRTSYRFGELYNICFNPSLFREEPDAKAALHQAWRELERMIGFNLSQESLATTLRVENTLNRLAAKRCESWGKELSAMLDGFEPAEYEAKRFPTPEAAADQGLSAAVPAKLLSAHFKTAKQFFEGSGKASLRAELEPLVNEPMNAWVERETERLTAIYERELQAWLADLKERRQTELREHGDGLRDALQMKIDVAELERLVGRLKTLAE
ncbi:dynamin family protein [Paenibacillus chartarius]|uniref:Dynamin family protein n=1 Tax=Paenibacillus chartarius TaxID=747481 RepID=A0ABV6DQ48_9BACL